MPYAASTPSHKPNRAILLAAAQQYRQAPSSSYSSSSYASPSTEALLPQKGEKDYQSALANLQGSIGLSGSPSTMLPPLPASSGSQKPKSEGKRFWSRQPKQPSPLSGSEKSQPQQQQQQPQQQGKKEGKEMSREEALELLMDRYALSFVQSGGRSGRM